LLRTKTSQSGHSFRFAGLPIGSAAGPGIVPGVTAGLTRPP